MTDIINLLPDSVANQIAAGEVIQRPASAVKELLENAIDSGADTIKLIIKDAGKAQIQVVDNGCGMSPTDARMSFERHATSKIQKADDLFHIQTMGFRGEALASIAAIAQVELKTKTHDKEMGTHILVEGSKVLEQTEASVPSGTIFTIKNLFYNTPARRNFLKSNNAELRRITEEFLRVALIHPEISFSYFDNDRQKFLLSAGNFKQRIISVFGKTYKTRLLNVDEKTSVVEILGFVGKPETARKTRGEQYFFVNHRFIKHPYLNHAVLSAFDELIPDGAFPPYFLHLKVDPTNIDVNIHPTKTEVNFRDEKAIYSIIKAAVKMSLGKFALSPQIDFDVEQSLDLNPLPAGTVVPPPTIHVNPDYNPFEQDNKASARSNVGFSKPQPSARDISNAKHWHDLYDNHNNEQNPPETDTALTFEGDHWQGDNIENQFIALKNQWLMAPSDKGIVLIDRQAAHERVLFDRFSALAGRDSSASQRKIFPDKLMFSAADADLIKDLLPELKALGFEINPLDNNEFEVYGTPPDLSDELLTPILEGMLEYYKLNKMELKIDKRQNLLLSMARNLSVRPGHVLSTEENNALIQALFESSVPDSSPSGKPIIKLIGAEELAAKFKQ